MYKIATTPGEKIKEIRSQLNLYQIDLTSPDISRPLISLYENNKVPISHKNLTYFYDLFSKHAVEKGIALKYTFDEFIKSIEEQINDQVDSYTLYIKKIIDKNELIEEDIYQDIIKFVVLENISSEHKYRLHETIGDYQYYIKNQHASFYHMEKAFDSVLFTEYEDEKLRIANKIIRKGIYLRQGNLYPYLDLLNHYIDSYNREEIIIYHYNRAIVYKLYGDYRNALIAVTQILDEWIEEANKRDELILFKANLNEVLGNFQVTLNYLEKLKESESEEYRIIARLNEINVVMIHKNDETSGKELFDDFLSEYSASNHLIQKKCSKKYLPSIYYYMAKFYHYILKNQDSIELIKKSLNSIVVNTNTDTLKDIYSLCIELLEEIKDTDLLELSILKIEESFEHDPVAFSSYLKELYKSQGKYL